MRHPEYQYLDTLRLVRDTGEVNENRTGVNTRRILGVTHRYDFKDGFPLFTTKRVWWKGVAHELLWFLSGNQNIKYLVENGVNIWTDDAYRVFSQKVKDDQYLLHHSKESFVQGVLSQETLGHDYTYGDMGPVYGVQWRAWDYGDYVFDQVASLVHDLKTNPLSRRHILSAWNAPEVGNMGLPPCHVMSQYTVTTDGKLWCHMYQRSCDMFLGVPFNVASYSLLTYMLAQVTNLKPGGFIHTMHDCHIYENHLDAVAEQLEREPTPFPQLDVNPFVTDIDDFQFDDLRITNYEPHPAIKAELNVGL